ncbi:alpha/beta hydrolase [Photobacterium phosphoreum]|uniref:alpha/beta hydrolase n=1 Tax=Photobacterium phosphoreum TaxID=659 RepID=UPI0005D36CB4|nr:alpha/beta hydrolase [Photobacterium phosphoreum]MCD9479597.1 alpha/beta fold hydrolase [Photobacterium phosphoreum]MCD9482538.1 alpha/beta fold hydrolase [Photobacterium phosphoreum]PQJ90652.1 alpha/beta hydrolase [Photobacterium phosphoreum]PSU37836.1 alpha/beta hydrolase [Photobacterium phosphoreum]PSU63125.1 alpha/beta hydrolase [Photobacterium phosphoreum]
MREVTFTLAEYNLAACSSVDITTVRLTSKPVLLLLHGWQDNAATFASLWALLTKDYDVIALDWPGHGKSDYKSADNYYHFVDYIDDLHQVITQLKCEKVHIIGHSLGAIVAGCYAAVFPEYVDKIILIEGLSPLTEPPQMAVERLRMGIVSRQRYRQQQLRLKQRSMATFAEALTLRAAVNRLPASLLEAVVTRATIERDGRWYWRHDPRLRCDSLYRMAQQHAQALLSSIQAPVLSIIGDHGYSSLHNSDGRGWNINDFTQVVVFGGHHCHLQSSKGVYRHIRTFIPTKFD